MTCISQKKKTRVDSNNNAKRKNKKKKKQKESKKEGEFEERGSAGKRKQGTEGGEDIIRYSGGTQGLADLF